MSTHLFQELFPWYRTHMDVLVPITFKLTPRLVEMIDEAQAVTGEGRAQFVRNAIAEKLATMKMPVAPEDRLAPPRTGVGGYPTQKRALQRRVEIADASALMLNESPPAPGGVSSDVARGAVAGADAVAAMVGRSATPAPSPKAASTTYKKRGQPARTAPRRNSPRSVPARVPNERGNPT